MAATATGQEHTHHQQTGLVTMAVATLPIPPPSDVFCLELWFQGVVKLLETTTLSPAL